MTLLETIQAVEGVAMSQPAVNMIVRDSILNLNFAPNNKFGAFVWTQQQHAETVDNDLRTFRFVFFYVDRVTRDRANVPEIQSTGIEVLSNIIRVLGEELDITDWTYNTFTERIKDECAGAYATVALRVPIDMPCPMDWKPYLLTAEGWNVVEGEGRYVLVR